MGELLLSIVVPVYKVEKELPRCIESLIAQDFESKEIILIDDGSPDECGKICDSYVNQHKYIQVIHQKNKGLAAVRNTGVAASKGKYISFIDSDDYVEAGLYSHMFSIIEANNAEIACFGHVDVYNGNDSEIKVNNCSEVISIYTASEAVDQIFFENNIDVITCNKIIEKRLFEGITYPVGMLYEDMFTTYKYLSKAKTIASTNFKYYIYCHRETSIGAQKYNSKTMDLAKAVEETYKFGLSFCEKKENLHVGYLYWMTVVANIMIRNKHYDDEYFNKVQGLSRKFRKKVIGNMLLNKTRKLELLLFGINLPLYRVFYKAYIRINR